MKPAFYGQVLVKIEGELFAITLPPTLYRMYLGLISDLERGVCNTHATGLCRRDAHNRLRDWFAENYPHVSIEEFDSALERRVEADIT